MVTYTHVKCSIPIQATLERSSSYTWVAAGGVFPRACALLAAIRPVRVHRTRQIARHTEEARRALAVAHVAVTVPARALLRTRLLTGGAVVARWAAVLAALTVDARRTGARAVNGVTRATVLAAADAVAARAVSVL